VDPLIIVLLVSMPYNNHVHALLTITVQLLSSAGRPLLLCNSVHNLVGRLLLISDSLSEPLPCAITFWNI
jgi:hypothetical protein